MVPTGRDTGERAICSLAEHFSLIQSLPGEQARRLLSRKGGPMTKRDKSGNYRIQVTEEDIRKAVVNSSMKCVVARAIARSVPDASRVDVDTQTIRWSTPDERVVYLTPYSVQGYVIAFDAGEEIQPFTFVLDRRRRVPVQSKRKTPAGKAIARTTDKVRRQRRKVEQLELVAKGETVPPATPTKRMLAEEELGPRRSELTEAERTATETRAAYAGAVQNEMQGEGRPKAQPRVFKTNERHYGQRALRINQ